MPQNSDTSVDNRLQRGQETRRLLMRAAEKLIAEKGVEQISIREILSEARQNNTSAMQYHFGSLKGLIAAIVDERSEQTRLKRAELLAELQSSSSEISLRQLAALMIRPSFELARTDPGYRRYIKAFGHQLTMTQNSVEAAFSKGAGGESGIELGRLLKQELSHLSDEVRQQRLDFAVRLSASAMSAQVRAKKAFRGQQSDFFLEGLIDAVVGLFTGPEGSS